MKTTSVETADLAASVLAVPPLARDRDLRPSPAENRRLIAHLRTGGVRTLMYGGNANFYNIAVSEYRKVLDMLAELAAGDAWVIPSAGPDYGRMMDQAAILRQMNFPTAMVLPQSFPCTPEGAETGIRHFADRLGRPVIVYLKAEGYLTADGVARLVGDGLVAGIKYAVVRAEPRRDAFLDRLLERIDRRMIVSGIGERPAIAHFRAFGLAAFTSGSVCVAPAASMRLLAALQAGADDEAAAIREAFLPLEDLRDRISPIRVLHDAVTLAGIADMGPILPLLSNLTEAERPAVAAAAGALLDFERRYRRAA